MTSENSYKPWYFLLGIILLFIITSFVNFEKFYSSIIFFKDLLLNVIPILLFIFVLMVVTNYFVKPKTLVKYLGHNSGIKGWIITIFAGILSSGPIYMWYPLLNDLQRHGMKPSLIATFLYNRAIKLPLLPLLFVSFGMKYSFVLMVIMIFISVIQGLITEKFMERIK